MNLRVSKARSEDAPALKMLAVKAYQQYVDRMGKPPEPMLINYSELIKTQSDQSEVYAVKDNEIIVGMLVLKVTNPTILLENVAVDPEKQGLGGGRMLLEKAESRAIETGFHEILLYTNKKMTENITLYEHFGYKVSHCIEERGKEHSYERIYMSKVLTKR